MAKVSYKIVRGEAQPPRYMTIGASGMDVCAAIAAPVQLAPMARVLIPTGLQFALPVGFELQVRPRSGLALKKGVTCLNSPGTIDADYRGEVQVLLINLSQDVCEIAPGERVAQLVLAEVGRAELEQTQELPPTARGSGGFGHTGA
jgi:dUTP pyrophosphatase